MNPILPSVADYIASSKQFEIISYTNDRYILQAIYAVRNKFITLDMSRDVIVMTLSDDAISLRVTGRFRIDIHQPDAIPKINSKIQEWYSDYAPAAI